MARYDPPPPSSPLPGTLSDDHPIGRVHFRLWQISVAAGTIFVTGWCYTLDTTLGLAVTFLAKHVLVAVLAAGLGLPELRRK